MLKIDKQIKIIDSTLRDGNHTVSNGFTPDDIREVSRELELAGVDYIEVGYGYGLNSFKGEGAATDYELIRAAVESVNHAKIAVLAFADRARVEDIEMAYKAGARLVRIAVQSSDAQRGVELVRAAGRIGIEVGGFMMMAHRVSAEEMLKQARILVNAGATSITVTDSAGAFVPEDIEERIELLLSELKVQVGIHCHDNLGLAIGNSLAAIESGATFVDTALCGLGAGAGNAPTERLITVLKKRHARVNADMMDTMEASCELEDMLHNQSPGIKSKSDEAIIGYTGVYSTFLKTAKSLAKKYEVDFRDIIMEASSMNLIAGDEDRLVSIAQSLTKRAS